jgi:hypothetical protein
MSLIPMVQPFVLKFLAEISAGSRLLSTITALMRLASLSR